VVAPTDCALEFEILSGSRLPQKIEKKIEKKKLKKIL
jgi:hypothetical protein